MGRVIIRAVNLRKEFRRPRRQTGPLGGLGTLLARQYDITIAVDDISFDVAEGELVGYLGPNGAGKSTTIKMLTGILVPTSGKVVVAGRIPWRERERNALEIGVVFGQRSQLWWDLPLIESFKLIGKLYRVTPQQFVRNLDRFTHLLGLDAFLATPVRQLSLGQRMRGDLAAVMLYEPRILYLDEPTVGLDVVAKERMLTFIDGVNRESGTTIILTTHDLQDVERLCRRIVLIDRGRVLYDGPVERLVERYAPHRMLVVQFSSTASPALSLPHQADVSLDRQESGKVWIRFDPNRMAVADLIAAVTRQCAVSDLSIMEPDLEGVVRQIYEGRHLAS